MDRVGIRELRQHASAVIRRVVAGESLEVTDRGRAVARIIPLRPTGVVDQMITEGRAVPAHGDLLEVTPLRPLVGRPSLSQVLTDMRADER
ncbi:MAG: type II toxin-antitoxin system prevent-host-death family antitoxin [Chloroflexi bacterium]|nr:MAG: type II toxin-antitoxin system prevent-host-death family antitoxin [Chloroflexota bacterium]